MDVSNVHRNGNYVADPVVLGGYGTGFWTTITGTPAATGTGLDQKVRLASASMASKVFYRYLDLEMALNIPVKPTAGQVRQFGLAIPSAGNSAKVVFDITDTAFTGKVYDNTGTLVKSTTLIFVDAWATVETLFGIRIGRDGVKFLVGGSVLARVSMAGRDPNFVVPDFPQSIYINNGTADNMDVGAVIIRNASSFN